MTTSSILITGCASGIGNAAALALKQKGYQVIASARKPEQVAALKDQGLTAILLDVNNADSIHEGVAETLALTKGKLYALFNNAGYLQAGAIEDLSLTDMREQFETNVFGPMELIRAVLPSMRLNGRGRIIQNSSILGIITLPYYGAYNASKFALEGFSLTLRQELAGTGIYVSCINPGPIQSNLREKAYGHYAKTIGKAENSLHKEAYTHLEQVYFTPSKRDQAFALTPQAVIQKLLLALESKHPRAHYYVGMPAQTMALLKRLLPDRALHWLLTRI